MLELRQLGGVEFAHGCEVGGIRINVEVPRSEDPPMQCLDLGGRERTAWVCSHWLLHFRVCMRGGAERTQVDGNLGEVTQGLLVLKLGRAYGAMCLPMSLSALAGGGFHSSLVVGLGEGARGRFESGSSLQRSRRLSKPRSDP